VVAKNAEGSVFGPTLAFVTQAVNTSADPCANKVAREQTTSTALLDCRAFELVSPIDKNGGQIDLPGTLAGGGVLQASAGGGAITYGSSASFGAGATGSPSASQYISTRGSGGWATQNISTPLYSDSYGAGNEGVPFQLFSGDLARGLLLNGRHCRGEATDCAVPNPPLAGTGAPAGYQNFYLRDSASSGFEALLGPANGGFPTLDPSDFELRFAGAASDLRHVVLSTCAALTPSATEVPAGQGCDSAKPNLYEFSPGAGLGLVNLLPAQTIGTPGAALGAQAAAVSSNGARVYWNDLATGNLYVREAGQTKQVDTAAGGGGVFQTASADGSIAFYTKAGHLYRYEAGPATSTDLTPSGGVTGVLGASEDGSYVYYLNGSGLFLRHGATTSSAAAAADTSNYPPTTGTSRVSADGTRLLFVSTPALTGYDNKDAVTGNLDSQVYLYNDNGGGSLTCVSCNPTNVRPSGSSTIPGAVANGQGPSATDAYKPRALSNDGRRVFFQSTDVLAATDINGVGLPDVYEWEAQGSGSCTRPGGCLGLISSGRDEKGATFVDASADGSDAFFIGDRSLVKSDIAGSVDLYDAHEGGGFAEAPAPVQCIGENCHPLEPQPVDPTLTTLGEGPGNDAPHYPGEKHCKKTQVKTKKGKCVKKGGKKKSHHKRSGR